MFAGLAPNGTRTVAPFVDFRRQISLAVTQDVLLLSERLTLIWFCVQKLTSKLVEFISSSNELTLDRVCLTVERLLYLTQAEADCYAVPSLAQFVQIIDLKVACSPILFCLPRRVLLPICEYSEGHF